MGGALHYAMCVHIVQLLIIPRVLGNVRERQRLTLGQSIEYLLRHVLMAGNGGMNIFNKIIPECIICKRRELINFGVRHFRDDVFCGAFALKTNISIHLDNGRVCHFSDGNKGCISKLHVTEWIIHTHGHNGCVGVQFTDASDDRVPILLEHGLTVLQGGCKFCQNQRCDTESFSCGKDISGKLSESAKAV